MKEELRRTVPISERKYLLANVLYIFAILVTCIIAVYLGFLQFRGPEVKPLQANAEQFSAERALRYLENFAISPHPVGSPEHERVRDYLVNALEELGLSPEIQTVADSLFSWGEPFDGIVENILARIPGQNSSQAIMLTAHYDSEHNSPGAADDGAAVAAILETVRILQEGEPLKNDVIILLSDGEELGLLGAQAFVNEHPWVHDIGIVLNFEARGSEGPSVLFETNEHNERLIEEFAKGSSHPIAHSFISDLYRMMPNETDLTLYKSHGMYGLNFAFFEGTYGYHSPEDSIENLSIKSLQHHGENMLELVHHFGNMELEAKEDGSSLFFNLFAEKVVFYGKQYVIPIMIAAIFLFILTCVHGIRKQEMTTARILFGFLFCVLSVAFSYFAAEGLLKLYSALTGSDLWSIGAYPKLSNPLFISILFMIAALLTGAYSFILDAIKGLNFFMGSLLGWLILTVVSSFLYQDSSYIFVWPYLFALIGVNVFLRIKKSIMKKVVSLIIVIFSCLFITPIMYLVYVLLTIHYVGVLAAAFALSLVFIIPAFSQIRRRYLSIFPAFLLLSGVLTFLLVWSH
ncbi:M28 family peptidase [Robertmurraya sp. FSL W8-0741]|uniref:M28 family peptidase n=1 Tax=Robertmurraya sp. FSL W8-0741 TaxID=2954629 RepID=UPI0030F6608A